jgi:HSP20 family protein
MRLDDIRQGLSSLLDSVAEGWHHLRQSASNALTRFRPADTTNMPARSDIDDMFYMPGAGWSMLGGDIFEDASHLVVRLEVPGMNKEDLTIEVQDHTLIVSGEKRFEREDTPGRYRVLQCAYGKFRRMVPLPASVEVDQAQATYRNGVLRIALPKIPAAEPRRHTVRVD